jgi:hypothetical protein
MTMHDDCMSKRPRAERSRRAVVSWRAASNVSHELFSGTSQTKPAAGEIWTIQEKGGRPGEKALLAVIIAAGGNDAAIVPLSNEPRHATEWDLTLPREVLGYPAIAQVKLAGKVAASQLEQRLSSLPPWSLDQLRQLSSAAEHGQSLPPEHLPVGPWVLSEADKRLGVRRDQAQRLIAYLTPSYPDPTAEWQSFGSILARGARASGIELKTLLDEPAAAQKLQRDEMDLFSELPARRLAALLAKLSVKWTEPVRGALYQLVLQRYHPVDVLHGVALARRRGRRAKGTRRSRGSEKERRDAAESYVREVERGLQEK